jgi:DNA-binding NtrC family response regulator
MPSEMQVALLRAIEEQRVMPVGSGRAREVDVRVVAATNRDLESDVRRGRFREDLFHRLSVVTISLPPLRERLEDLPILAAHLLARMPEKRALHVDAMGVLSRYGWPGNVRELDNVLRAAALLVDGPEVTPEILERILEGRRQDRAPDPSALPPRASALLDALGDRWLSTPEIAATLRVSPRTVNRELVRLLEQGLVRGSGMARARRYHRTRWRDVSGSASQPPTQT